MDIQSWGALCFGSIIGWYVYYINRYRQAEVQFSDLVTVIGILGGSAVLKLFDTGTDLFGAYGIGLFAGFFGYLLVLTLQVWRSDHFNVDFFLDGRRIGTDGQWTIPHGYRKTIVAMGQPPPRNPGDD